MMYNLQSFLLALQQRLTWLRDQAEAVSGLVNAVTGMVRQLRAAGAVLFGHRQSGRAAHAYETLWLELVFDLEDALGERAVLTRRQRVRFLAGEIAGVRELVWGEGRQLVRYSARGARRLAVRAEGSKCAVLLEPDRRPVPGGRQTITSRRTIRGGFRTAEEYCEAFLERPTGRLEFTIRFPATRPPRAALLVFAASEQVLRRVPVRFGADGRALLRCRIQRPATATLYSLRWSW